MVTSWRLASITSPQKVLILQSHLVPNQAVYILGTFCAGLGRPKNCDAWTRRIRGLPKWGHLSHSYQAEPRHLCTGLSSQNLLEHWKHVIFNKLPPQKWPRHLLNHAKPQLKPQLQSEVLHERIPHSCHSPTCLKSPDEGPMLWESPINEFVS